MFRKILISIFLLFCVPLYAVAASIHEKVETAYEQFYSKIESQYGREKQIQILISLENKLNSILATRKLSLKNEDVLRYLFDLNAQKISDIEKTYEKPNIIAQKEIELREVFPLKNLGKNATIPSYVQNIIDKGLDILFVSDGFEFYDNGKVKKVSFTNYYDIDSKNYPAFYDKQGIIVKSTSNSYIFVEKYSFVEKIPYSQFFSEGYSQRFLDEKVGYVLGDDDVYYTYTFQNYNVIEGSYGIYKESLKTIGIDLDTAILYRDSNGKFGFLNNPVKVKLISASILNGLNEPGVFLRTIVDDKKWLQSDTDISFTKLKIISLALVKDTSTDEEKIKKIYSWILENITYTKNINLSDRKIFSGIETFVNKDGVCDGYTKLMTYMLLFAGIKDVEQIKGDVIDAQDFPQIGHAWVRVGDYYYDPTFDDPLGLSEALTYVQYKYFKLPKDIFYTNRYNFGDTPEYLKSYTMNERKTVVLKNLSNYVDKYIKNNYNLLKALTFRSQNNLNYDSIITTDVLKKILPYYEVRDFSFTANGQKKTIEFLQFYVVTNQSIIETVLAQHGYDKSGFYLFKWIDSNGKYDYRIAYDVKIK